MASTNKTAHYELSQYVGSDKPTYLTDYNNDMSAIDTGIYNAQDKANSAYTLAGGAEDKADNAQSTANTALTNAGTANTNIGTMANLETTEKTNLVGAINEVEGNVEKFNLTSFTTYSGNDLVETVVSGSALAEKNGSITVATNSDGSIFKLYSYGLGFRYSGAGSWKITISTSIRPTNEITISAGMKFYENSGRTPFWISSVSFKVKTNGDVEISFSKDFGDDAYQEIYFPPCLYFAKDFGDVSNP